MTDRFDEMAQAIWLGAQGRGALADALRKVHEEQAAALAEANRKLALLRAVAESAARVADRSLAVDDSGHGFCIFCGLRKRAEGHCCEAAALRRNVKAAREGGAL